MTSFTLSMVALTLLVLVHVLGMVALTLLVSVLVLSLAAAVAVQPSMYSAQ